MKLEIRGRHLVRASDNQPVILRGAVGAGWVFGQNTAYQAREVEIFRKWTTPVASGGYGANAIQVWASTDRTVAAVTDYVRQVRNAIQPNGAYTLVGYAMPANAEHPQRPNQKAMDYMAAIARTFKDDDSVLFITQIEPGAGHPDTGVDLDSLLTWPQLKPHLEAMYGRIRAEKPGAVIGIPGARWSQNFREFLNDPPFGNRDNAHAKPFFVTPHCYDWERKNDPELEAASSGVAGCAARYPVVVGEFGQAGGHGADWIVRFVDYLETAFDNVGWTIWNLSDRAAPTLLSAHDPDALTGGGVQARAVLAKYSTVTPVDPLPPDITPPDLPSAPVLAKALAWQMDRMLRAVARIEEVAMRFESGPSRPVTRADLEAIHGVGPKTAGDVMNAIPGLRIAEP